MTWRSLLVLVVLVALVGSAAALLSDDAGAAEGPMRRRVACRATCVEAKP